MLELSMVDSMKVKHCLQDTQSQKTHVKFNFIPKGLVGMTNSGERVDKSLVFISG